MTQFLIRSAVVWAAASLLIGCTRAATTTNGRPPRQPNILVIMADDLGYGELGAYGGTDIPTPNIDSIATNGVRFTSGYVSCPVCSPTRAGLLTGRYQQRFGHEFNPGPAGSDNPGFGLPLTEKTIADRLAEGGYATALIGKWHLGFTPPMLPPARGFQTFFGFPGGAHGYFAEQAAGGNDINPIYRGTNRVKEPEYLTDAFAREAVAFIDQKKDEPFFLFLSFNAVHSPLEATNKYRERFAHIPDERRRNFAAMLSAMDDAVAAVLDKLRKEGLEEDTLVFFLSDNGGPTPNTTSRNGPLRDTKGTVYEGGVRVPFMVQWKGTLPAGKADDRPVIALDILPTALAAAGVTPTDAATLDGVNLLPYLTGQNAGRPHQTLYWRFGEQLAVRHGDMKLVKTRNNPPELYDLTADIGEQNNLAVSKPRVLAQLRREYKSWDAQLVAPLWEPILKKPGRKREAKAG